MHQLVHATPIAWVYWVSEGVPTSTEDADVESLTTSSTKSMSSSSDRRFRGARDRGVDSTLNTGAKLRYEAKV